MNWKRMITATCMALCLSAGAQAIDPPAFDFAKIEKQVRQFSVIVDIRVELSFGTQTEEQKLRLLGTIINDSGLIIFNGEGLSDESGPSMSGMTMKIRPTRLTAKTLDGKEYSGEFLGVDRFTHIGFGQLKAAEGARFTPVRFAANPRFEVGSWLGLYMLLPEFANPPLAADVGMISAQIESPEKFTLTMGLGPAQATSILFDRTYTPVGVVGSLPDPSAASSDAGGMLQDFGATDFPLMGVITGERIARLAASPPRRGKEDRSWLGISLQALTPEIADYLKIPVPRGIIVNEVMRSSPASKAGLQIGDVIISINGVPISVDKEERVSIFQRMISELTPGTHVEFSVYRPKENQTPSALTMSATIERAPMAAGDAPEYENKLLEFKVRDMVLADYIANNITDTTLTGVVVSNLKSGGLAMVGGVRLGDIVQKIGSTGVTKIDDAKAAMEAVEKRKPAEVVFFVWRDGKTMFVNVKTD
jgi:serine protease Do